MSFRFRKRIKIVPGLYVNLGKRGASMSVGVKGATVNFGSKRGIHLTTSIPGTGISYTQTLSRPKNRNVAVPQSSHQNFAIPTTPPPLKLNTNFDADSQPAQAQRKVSLLLGLGIFFLPYIFAWFLLRRGYSTLSRILGFGWLAWLVFSTSIHIIPR
jgi:hypothetical protein